MRSTQKTTRLYGIAKRAIDIVGGLALLALALPVMLLAAGWLMVMDGRPVFYRQWRVGRDGWLFRIWKFRTMTRNAERGGARFATGNDARIVPGCRWMRLSHVDELPQLVNILLGQMSLVGPRPERPEMMEEMRATLPGIDRRLASPPGLTGLAQVVNGYTNDLSGMRRKLALDLHYLRRRSVWRDVALMLATAPKLWDRAAC